MTSKYTTDLRLIAIVTMLIDHLGLIFFPQFIILRIVGRLSFPLFAWGVALGAKYTHDIKKYIWRLFLFALISQYPFYLFGSIVPGGIAKLNVLFTLLFGLVAIQTYRSKIPVLLKFTCFYLLIYLSIYFDMDYQGIGVLSVLFSYIFAANFKLLLASQFLIFSISALNSFLPIFAPLSFFLTRLPQSKPNPKYKYLFYIVYPLQFLLIYLIKK